MRMTYHLHNQLTDGWTQERRERQSRLIQAWQPWTKSTGPRTAEGKAKSSQNAFKSGSRPLFRMIDKVLRKQQQSLDELSAEYYDAMADKAVAAALEGDFRAIEKIADAIDD